MPVPQWLCHVPIVNDMTYVQWASAHGKSAEDMMHAELTKVGRFREAMFTGLALREIFEVGRERFPWFGGFRFIKRPGGP